MESLSPGRWRGLKATSVEGNVFTILAFDQRGTYRRMMPDNVSYGDAVALKKQIVTALAPYTSAVLLDSMYGLDSAMSMSGQAGLIMSLEKSGYSGDATYRGLEFQDGWTVEKIKRMGASAVKMMVYYHPDTDELAEQLEDIVRKVSQECHQYDLPLFLEPMSYSLDAAVAKESEAFAKTRPYVVRETARRLSALGPDVIKLEFPVDVTFNSDEAEWRRECEAVSEACAAPWVLLSAGVSFDTFEQQVLVACEGGASGFLAGRAVWKEAIKMSPEERVPFLAEVAPERLRRLTDITVKHAKPWTEFYAAPMPDEDWYQSYETLPTR
ncbi:tagatose 1,6-diphosphate aldolase [Aggregatilinea lenta]|uniref:tagatose 1,6-diphosphate aldolase n=1 Tax=Aggregatilinea lenta TaxID=913108 RepID=UPI000E5BECDD|nr:tagatose 1,6-diphosphate aldolase [Aggregatilinea lenta]